MAGILDLIRDWATQLPYWEQAALDKVSLGVPLTEEDYKDLLDSWMRDAGLVAAPASPRPPLTFPTKLSNTSDAAGCVVERIFNVHNVNALPEAQEIHFGPQLTVIYGPNGSGKTSYTRPLGCAAFARGEREVLTDARRAFTETLPQTDIEISQGGEKKTITWVSGSRCPELSGIYVFDGPSINAHLTQSNALSFSPSGLAFLTKLAVETDAVRARLRTLIASKSVPHTFGIFFPADSVISREIAALNGASSLAGLETFAVLDTQDQQNFVRLDQQIAQLKLLEPSKRQATLSQEVKDLRNLLSQLDTTTNAVGTTAEAEVNTLVQELARCRQEAEKTGSDQFRFEQFTQTGTAVWREFIISAKALAEAEDRGSPYPENGDPCLFCRQALSPESISLINRLWQFLSSDAPVRFEAAKLACSNRAKSIQKVTPSYFGSDAPARRIIEAETPEVVPAIDAYIRGSLARERDLCTVLTEGTKRSLAVMPLLDTSVVQQAITRRLAEITELEKSDTDKKLERAEQQLRLLQHRRALGEHLTSIKDWVSGQQWAARAQKAIGSTRHITEKYNELFELLVTEKYRNDFQLTLYKLKRNLKLTIATKGQKGETLRQIVLSPDSFVQNVAIDKVLSDGEKRAVALADFLTEVSLDAASGAIILDDPVSSFDSDSKVAVAQLLAENASRRQVIVFTHDLAFLHGLKEAAKKLSVGVVSHWIRCEEGHPGYVYLDNTPLCEGDYKSAKIARGCYEKARSAAPEEQERLLQQGFGALRSTYEAFVIYGLFNGVVKRFEERVGFDQLKGVTLDRDVIEKVVDKLGALSRHIDAHLHSDAFGTEKPTPDVLLEEIATFEELQNKHKQSQKAVVQVTAMPAAKASSKQPEETTVPFIAAQQDIQRKPN